MTESDRNQPLDFPVSTRQENRSPDVPENYPSRGHLPPPFYNANDDANGRRQYLSEARLPDHLYEDTGNYGRGGYYGSTYDQTSYNKDRMILANRRGQPDNYRQLGDHRWSDERLTWEKERSSRPGYRPLKERMETANHHGKGPRSWRRSDQRILEDINDRLYDDPFLDATNIEVEIRDGEVFLTGTVDSRQAKRRAEDIGESVSGVRYLENRLRVKNEVQV